MTTLHAPTGREVWAVAEHGEETTWHATKAEALRRVDALARPGRELFVYVVDVEGEA